jgi:hypothetical protein
MTIVRQHTSANVNKRSTPGEIIVLAVVAASLTIEIEAASMTDCVARNRAGA